MPPRFLYFDLGKVLVDFSEYMMLQQVASAAGADVVRVREVLFDNGLQWQYERGQITSRQFYEVFCNALGIWPDYEALARAASDIFSLRYSMLPLVSHLEQTGYRLGILSNTCEMHWEHCYRRYRILAESFDVYALSYRIGACKPESAIFRAAAELAGCAPHEVFFVDDVPGHVAGAQASGFDAVVFTTTAALADELRRRGLHFNA